MVIKATALKTKEISSTKFIFMLFNNFTILVKFDVRRPCLFGSPRFTVFVRIIENKLFLRFAKLGRSAVICRRNENIQIYAVSTQMFLTRRLHFGPEQEALGICRLTFLDTVVGTLHLLAPLNTAMGRV
jgi:hypothetical protein